MQFNSNLHKPLRHIISITHHRAPKRWRQIDAPVVAKARTGRLGLSGLQERSLGQLR